MHLSHRYTPLATFLCLATACAVASAASSPAVKQAYADAKGSVHVITADGLGHIISPRKWQAGAGYQDVAIASDGKTVGWLANQMLTPLEGGTNYSYPVALQLDVWRDGHVIRKFPTRAYAIQKWIFLKGGNEVAFHSAPPHGQDFYDCTLFDVTTGRELAHWVIDRKNNVVPSWVKLLLSGDSLPSPDQLPANFR